MKISRTQTAAFAFYFSEILSLWIGNFMLCLENFLGKTLCVMVTESLPDFKIMPAAAAAKCYPLQFVSLPQHSIYIFSYHHSQLNSYKINFMIT